MENSVSFIEMSKALKKSTMFKILMIDVITSIIEMGLRSVDLAALFPVGFGSQRVEILLRLMTVFKSILFGITDAFQLITVILSGLSITLIMLMRDKIPSLERNRVSMLDKYHCYGNFKSLDIRAYVHSDDFSIFNFIEFLVWDQMCHLNKFNHTVIGEMPLVEVIGSNISQYVTFSAIQLVVALVFWFI